MKRIIPILLMFVLLSGCAIQETKSQPEPSAEESSSAGQTEKTEPTAENEPADLPTEFESTSQTESEPKSAEQERLESLILAQVSTEEGKELMGEVFGDLDGDGIDELFAFYGTKGEFYAKAVAGELYFASGDSTQQLLEKSEYTSPHTFIAESDILYTAEEQYATGSISRVFAVRDSRAVPVKFGFAADMKLHHIDGDEFEAFHSTYDITGNAGHTWKPYWYYYSQEDTAFIPYAAHEISAEQFMEYNGAVQAMDMIKSAAGDDFTLLLFDNGVVCANFTVEMSNKHFTWRISDGGLVNITEYGGGKPADGRYLIPQNYSE